MGVAQINFHPYTLRGTRSSSILEKPIFHAILVYLIERFVSLFSYFRFHRLWNVNLIFNSLVLEKVEHDIVLPLFVNR